MRSPHSATKSSPPLAATRESPGSATKTQCSQKKRNKWGPKINGLSFHFKKLESKEQIEQEVSKRKEIMVRVEINDIEDR